MEYKTGKLAQDRIADLESLDEWTWDILEADWQTGLECLRQYVAENNDARVAQHYITTEGFKLGSWVSSRRINYKTGKLPQNRITTIESFDGWIWDVKNNKTK